MEKRGGKNLKNPYNIYLIGTDKREMIMKYTFYYCDNGKLRFGHDEFITEVYEFETDREAYLKALEIQDPWSFDKDEYADLTDDEILNDLWGTDVGGLTPIVLWIKRGTKKFFNTGITRKSWEAK